MHLCTICEIVFLVGGPWKSNVAPEKSLKNSCIFCMNPESYLKVQPKKFHCIPFYYWNETEIRVLKALVIGKSLRPLVTEALATHNRER